MTAPNDNAALLALAERVDRTRRDIDPDDSFISDKSFHELTAELAAIERELRTLATRPAVDTPDGGGVLTFDAFRAANVARCVKWHPDGMASWSPSDWLTAVTGELGELASLLKMRNRERDGLAGNKFSPTDKMVADELADVLTYLDLLAAVLGVDLGRAAVEKFNEVSERVGFSDRIELTTPPPTPDAVPSGQGVGEDDAWCGECGVKLESVRPGKHQHPVCSAALAPGAARDGGEVGNG